MGFLKEFKTFAVKGNVMDLAVGVIIGAAFGKIVSSLVADLLMPLVGLMGDGARFVDRFIVLTPSKEGVSVFTSLVEAREAGANVFAYGNFIQTVVDFLIIAFSIFVIIKAMNNMKKKEEAAAPPPGPSSTDQLLIEIRDQLKKN